MTVFYIFLLNGKREILRSTKTIFALALSICSIGIAAILFLFHNNEQAFNWAFEIFINFSNNGTLESDSTNQLQEMYVLPDNIKTWLIGDGRISNGGLGFYMDTDVGYIRSLFYWGLIGSIIYYYVQYKYYSIVRGLIHNIYIRKYLFMIVLWFYIYNLKDFWRIDQFLVLFLFVALDISKQNDNTTYKDA